MEFKKIDLGAEAPTEFCRECARDNALAHSEGTAWSYCLHDGMACWRGTRNQWYIAGPVDGESFKTLIVAAIVKNEWRALEQASHSLKH